MQQNAPGPIPNLVIGGRTLTDIDNLIVLYAYVQGTTNTNGTFRTKAGVAYTPSGAKTFKILAVKTVGMITTVTANWGFGLGYSDNDVGVNGAVAYTNLVNLAGGATFFHPLSAIAPASYEYPVDFTIPNGKYIACRSMTANLVVGHCFIYGYEV